MSYSKLDALARALFRRRGAIGFVGFALVLVTGHGSAAACLVALPLLVAGLALRFWASGYIGLAGRAGEVGGERCVQDGPYRWFKLSSESRTGHPLYVGNFLLVAGMLVAFLPPWFVSLAVVVGFVVEYSLMASAEERYFEARFSCEPAVRTRFELRRAALEWRTSVAVFAAWGLALAKARLG